MIEVPSEHDSGCNLDDNLYLHFNYSIRSELASLSLSLYVCGGVREVSFTLVFVLIIYD